MTDTRTWWSLAAVLAVGVMGTEAVNAQTFVIDRDRTTITYRTHTFLAGVKGRLPHVEGRFEYDPARPEQCKVSLAIRLSRADLKLPPSWYDVVKYPTITFESTHMTETTQTQAKLHGVLTLHGVQQPVAFDLRIVEPSARSPQWQFFGQTTISRRAFGIVGTRRISVRELFLHDELDIMFHVEGAPRGYSQDETPTKGG